MQKTLAGAIVVFGIAFITAAMNLPRLELQDPVGPKAFPILVGLGIIAAGLGLAFEIMRAGPAPEEARPSGGGQPVAVIAVLAWTLLYMMLLEPVGYLLTTPVFLFALMAYFNRGRWIANTVVPLAFSAGTYFTMTHLLGVGLPYGIIGRL